MSKSIYEKRKLTQMEETIKTIESDFIAWLSSATAPSVVDEITKSYRTINAMLVQRKALLQPLFDTTQIEQVETALHLTNKVFGSKKMRNTAHKLLTAYLEYLHKKSFSTPTATECLEVKAQENWIKFDFTNSTQFERTVPVYCCFRNEIIQGKNWARILVGLAEHEIAANNPSLDVLYRQPLLANRKDRPFFLAEKIEGLNCSELTNGYWVNINFSIPRLMDLIQALSIHCGYSKSDVVIYGIPKDNAISPRPFDIQEAVILLDVYLSYNRIGVSNSEAATIASQRLKSLAVHRGMRIDNAFRSATGIQNRLRSIGHVFEGTESASAPGTEVFREAVKLFNDNPEEYKRILNSVSQLQGLKYDTVAINPVVEKKKTVERSISMSKAEAYLLRLGLNGATVQQIVSDIQSGAAVYPTKNALEASQSIISMPKGRYVHSKAFVDLDEAKDDMLKILRTHFRQFGGYSNSKLLFGAASHDMSMFLNDNDCEDVDSVYSLAQYFFGKNTEDKFCFSYPHIFESEPDFPLNLKGLMINLARKNGGILNIDSAKEYLQKTMLTYGGIGQLLQVSSANTFLYHDENNFLLSEAVGIDVSWKNTVHDKLDNLFRQANVAYVIPRDINEAWMNTLPALPHGISWTILFLQEVLRNYPDIGFRSVSSGLEQASTTIAAAIVPNGSPLQSLPDIVTLYMQDKYSLPKRMTCEELRLVLREAGMLEGSELVYALPKALNDYRFSWTDENKMVLVRGN